MAKRKKKQEKKEDPLRIVIHLPAEGKIERQGTIVLERGNQAVMHRFSYAYGLHHDAIPGAIREAESLLESPVSKASAPAAKPASRGKNAQTQNRSAKPEIRDASPGTEKGEQKELWELSFKEVDMRPKPKKEGTASE